MPISLCRFYTFCLPVRCCHAFDAAGPTTSGMKWMTADEQAIYTVDYSRANADAECRLYTAYVRSVKQTVNSIMFYRNMMNFIPHCLTWSILSDRHSTPVYRIFSRVPCACSVVFLGVSWTHTKVGASGGDCEEIECGLSRKKSAVVSRKLM